MAASHARSRLGRLLGAAASGVLYASAQPDRGAWPLALVCLVPLLLALRGRALRERIALGLLAGTAAGVLLVLEPTGVAIARYFELPLWQGYVGSFLLAELFGALPFGLFAALCGDPLRHGTGAGVLRVATALVAAELARSTLLTGLPWGLLAYALTPVPVLAGSAALGGASLVSLLLGALGACGLYALTPGRRGRAAGLALVAAAGLALPGLLARAREGAPAVVPLGAGAPARPGRVRVLLVQGSLPAAWRRDPAKVLETLERLVALSEGHAVDLVVWPESAVNVPLPANEGLVAGATAGLRERGAHVLLGAPRVDPSDPGRLRISAVLFGPAGRLDHHDKTRLVPFTEYVPGPLSGLGLRSYDAVPGERVRPLRAGRVTLGPLVCYELIFPAAAREQVRSGAELLVNLSNDEWFGTTRGMEQHFAAAVLRAIETGRPVLRATNTGITAAVDPLGRVVARLPPDRPGSLALAVTPAAGQTLATRLPAPLSWLGLAVALLFALRDLHRWTRPRGD